jgi:hypothetical protein
MAVIIGSARHDEHGNCYSGGKSGDQTGQEVSVQKFYNHSKGWNVLRAKNNKVAEKLAEAMQIASDNKNIGYDQSERYGIIKHGINTKVKTECDCSSLVRACIIYASGKDVGDFNTSNERSVILKSGLFKDAGSYKQGDTLYNGDILVTRTKGHTVIVVKGAKKCKAKYYPKYKGNSNSIVEALKAVGEDDVSKEHRAEIAKKNGFSNFKFTSEENSKMLSLLKKGKLKK